MGRGAVPYSLQILGGGGARLHAEDDRKIGGEVLGLVHQAGLRGRGGGCGEHPPNCAVRTGPGVARLTCSMLPKHSSEPCWHWNCHFPETFLSCGRSGVSAAGSALSAEGCSCSYLSVAVRHQSDVQDLHGQQQPGGEELLHQEAPAGRAQALVV